MSVRQVSKVWLSVFAAVLTFDVMACEHWLLQGPFRIHQTNRLTIEGEFVQRGRELSGRAQYFSPTLGDGGTRLDGRISGSIRGGALELDVYWYGTYEVCDGECYASDYNAGGRYLGTITPDGTVSGLNFPKGRTGQQVRWRLDGRAKCTERPHDRVDQVRETGPVARPDRRGAVTRELGGFAPANPSDSMVSDQTPLGRPTPPQCPSGLVWRQARADDHVCVTPQTRARTQRENEIAESRRDPAGAYGPQGCYPGFVWREAFVGDTVCVTPEVRAAVRQDNR